MLVRRGMSYKNWKKNSIELPIIGLQSPFKWIRTHKKLLVKGCDKKNERF